MGLDPTGILTIFQPGILTKLFFTVLGLFYFVLALVIYRQISLMTQVLDSKISPVVKTAALAQIAATGVLFFLALVLA